MPYKSCEEEQLEDIRERENIDLIIGLLNYTKTLEEMVIELRSNINALTPSGEQLHFPIFMVMYMRSLIIIQPMKDIKNA